jgi:soluble lytic murein transglycosylase-like protein
MLGYFWPVEAREVVRKLSDPIVMGRVENYAEDIRFAAQESGLDPNLLAGIVYSESSGRLDVVSSAGAMGLTQLVPDAAHDASRRLGIEEPDRETLLSDARINLRLGAAHFAWTLDNEGGDVTRALIAYNAGRTKLRRWERAAGSYEAWYAKQVREGDSMVLAYARRVARYAEAFRRRGNIKLAEDVTP